MKTNTKFLIYGLIDPRTLLIRYVGRSSSGVSRPKSYKNPSNLSMRTSMHLTRWLKGLLAAGLLYEVVVLEELTSADRLNEAEKRWIAYGRLSAWPLVNLTAGGEGLSGYKLSPETKAKISAAHKGRIQSPESRAANARAQLGRKHSKETRRKMSQSAAERQASPEIRAHMRCTSTGYKHTPETKAKMRKPRRRPNQSGSSGTRARMRALALKRVRNANGTFQ